MAMEASAREKPFDRAPGLNGRGTARAWISTPRSTLWLMFLYTARRYAIGERRGTGKKEQTMKTKRTQKKQTTLVLGATGKTGRRVALRLATRGVPAGRWGLLRLLDVRDGSTEATEAGGGDRRDAVDQHTGGHPRLHDGAIRDCRC